MVETFISITTEKWIAMLLIDKYSSNNNNLQKITLSREQNTAIELNYENP